MPDPTDDEELSMLYNLGYGIRVQPWEADVQRLASMPGQYNLAAVRARNELNAIEQLRRDSLARLQPYTQDLQPEAIEKLSRSGILAALTSLLTCPWCSYDIKTEAYEVITSVVKGGSEQQVRKLVDEGCIRALCESPRLEMVPALQRLFDLGEPERPKCGRNTYADQIEVFGGLDWLKRSRGEDAWLAPNEEIEQLVRRFESAAENSDRDTTDRGLGWRLFYPFISQRRFPIWNREDTARLAIEESCPLATKLFISHRWATPEDPDPGHKHLPMVVEYLSRVFLVANGYLAEDDYTIKELVIGEGLREAFHESRLDQCRCGSVGWLDLRTLLDQDDPFFEKVTDVMHRRNFYRLLKHVHVWYDYSSLPQARGTQEELEFLDRALTHLANIVGGAEVLTLWGLESVNRAWCLFEVLVAKNLHFCSPESFHLGMVDRAIVKSALSGLDSNRAEQLAAYRGRPSQSILIAVNQLRQGVVGLSEPEIYEYLIANGLHCTKQSDLVRLANLMHRYFEADQSAGEDESHVADW